MYCIYICFPCFEKLFIELFSYITTTFMVESLSIANACLRHKKKESSSEVSCDIQAMFDIVISHMSVNMIIAKC